jgi:hypothetical protein
MPATFAHELMTKTLVCVLNYVTKKVPVDLAEAKAMLATIEVLTRETLAEAKAGPVAAF